MCWEDPADIWPHGSGQSSREKSRKCRLGVSHDGKECEACAVDRVTQRVCGMASDREEEQRWQSPTFTGQAEGMGSGREAEMQE